MFKYERKNPSERLGLIDEIRGVLIILTVIYHAIYLYYNMMPILMPLWLTSLQPLVYIGVGLFVFIAGASCLLSRNNFKRGIICFAIACVITIITLLWQGGNNQIMWGILHLIGFSIILYDLFRKPLEKTKAVWMVPILAVIFVVTFRLKDGYVGIPYLLEYYFGNTSLEVLFPLGITAGNFYSADYYPLLPWFALFLIGTYFGRFLKSGEVPECIKRTHLKPLAFVGRHTLIIYVVHTPVLIGIYTLLGLIL